MKSEILQSERQIFDKARTSHVKRMRNLKTIDEEKNEGEISEHSYRVNYSAFDPSSEVTSEEDHESSEEPTKENSRIDDEVQVT
jgi:hypothetical protein